LPSALAVLVALTGSIGLAVATNESYLPATASAGACRPTWVTAWQAAAQPGPAHQGLSGATVRMVVHPQVTGSEVRLRLSNAYGTTPLAIGAVTAARSDGAAGLILGTTRPVPFGGQQTVVIPPGGEVVSDAVPLVAEAGSPLAVSLFLPVVPQVLTQHWAMQAAYLSGPGDATFGDAGAFGPLMPLSVVLTGVEVYAPRPVNAVVAVGDSITDGMGAAPGESWPDVLGAHLLDTGGETTMAVLGAGISGNRLLADGIFDFAAAVADPAHPDRLAPAFDAGDGLHLSAAGYRALAAAVDPALLSGSPCLAGNPPARVLVANR
jgi:hypothetical protein